MNIKGHVYAEQQEEFEAWEQEQIAKSDSWSILFKTRTEYINALSKMSHPFHKQAMQIKSNRIANGKLKLLTKKHYSSEPTLVEDIANNLKFNV